jgi:3-oxoacyl-[acyl-carrier protein] reductase
MLKGKSAPRDRGSRGIGYAIVKKYAENGANVAFTYLNSAEKAKAIVDELTAAYGIKVAAYQSDAASYSASETLIADVTKEFGQIDILVNNAGNLIRTI